MRELKFRLWDDNTKRWVSRGESVEIAFSQSFPESIKAEANFYLEQYVGLKDKNGKEIYEGDIVEMPDNQVKPRYKVVKYIKAGFDPFQEGCMGCWSPDGDEVEVVGNIHENPELLGGDE